MNKLSTDERKQVVAGASGGQFAPRRDANDRRASSDRHEVAGRSWRGLFRVSGQSVSQSEIEACAVRRNLIFRLREGKELHERTQIERCRRYLDMGCARP